MDLLNAILPNIEKLTVLAYWITFCLVFAETIIGIGLFIPGSTFLLIMGAIASRGNFETSYLIIFAVSGAIIGDNLNYLLGRKFGTKIFAQGIWFIKKTHIDKSRDFFNKHGNKSIFIARFIPALKETVPLIAGTLSIKRPTFTLWNTLGAIGWSLTWTLSGYFFAQSLDTAQLWLSRAGFTLLVLAIFLTALYALKYIFLRKGLMLFNLIKSLWLSIKRAIIENDEIRKFTNRHPRLLTFLKARTDKNSFFGLTFSVLSLSFIYILFLFGGLMENILRSDVVTAVDIRISHLLLLFRDAELIKIFLRITVLGKWQLVLILSCLTILILWFVRKRSYIMPFITVIAGSNALNYITKLALHRSRPDIPVYLEKSFSFPSGHATIAIVLYGFIAYIMIRETEKWKTKVNIFFSALIIAILIGFSRLYLGVHFISDVLGGYLLGLLCLIIGISLAEYRQAIKPDQYSIQGNYRQKNIVRLGFSLGIIAYVIVALLAAPQSTKISAENQSEITLPQASAIFSNDSLRYSEQLTGVRQEPINFIILAKNDQSLIAAFSQAGWHLADNISFTSLYRIIKTAIIKQPYDTAPMTSSFWNAQTHDFGFEKPTNAHNPRQRHHARFWKTGNIDNNGLNIYVGTASFDQGVKWGITHRISPDIDTERELIFSDLNQAGMIDSFTKEKNVPPVLGQNAAGDPFFTDGELYIITIR